MRAEKFIQDYSRNCSNECLDAEGNYHPWLSIDEARRAVEIAREETLQEVKSKLLYFLNTNIDNKHLFEQDEPSIVDDNLKYRIGYVKGYEQAIEDLKAKK